MLEVPSGEHLRNLLKATPALTAGLPIFLVLFYAAYPSQSGALVLYPSAPLELNLNAISFYIFPHVNLVHLALNLGALFPLISRFEKANGTIHTGITLNLLAVFTALSYCAVGLLLYPSDGVAGLLGICFSLLTYVCHKEHHKSPVVYTFKVLGKEVSIPTEYFPFLNLFLVALFIPSTSFFGHLAAIGVGYMLAFGWLDFAYPPSKAVLFIERKLAGAITLLKTIVDFVSEEDVADDRGRDYTLLFLSGDLEADALGPYEPFERRLGTATD